MIAGWNAFPLPLSLSMVIAISRFVRFSVCLIRIIFVLEIRRFHDVREDLLAIFTTIISNQHFSKLVSRSIILNTSARLACSYSASSNVSYCCFGLLRSRILYRIPHRRVALSILCNLTFFHHVWADDLRYHSMAATLMPDVT